MDLVKIENLDKYDPTSLSDEVLRDDFRIALAWLSSLRRGVKLKYSISQVRNILDDIVAELVLRGSTTFKPDEMKSFAGDEAERALRKAIKPGLYLVEPHGRLIADGKKTLIVKAAKFPSALDRTFWLVSDRKVYGAIRITDIREGDRSTFKKLSAKHRVSEAEADKWWGSRSTYWFYSFKPVVKFSTPRRAIVPAGVQTFIRKVKFADEIKLVDLSDAELLGLLADSAITDPEFELDLSLEKARRFAPINPSGVKRGKEITLDEVLQYFKEFKVRSPFIMLVGGLVVNGKTEGDIDIVVRESEDLPDQLKHIIEWRIMRSFPPEYWDRFHFLWDNMGPFTDYIELYDMTIERVNPENKIHEMGDFEPRDDLVKAEVRAKSKRAKEQAEKAKRNDKITLGEFFYPLKSSISSLHGYRSGEEYSVDSMVKVLKEIAKRKKLETEIVPSVVQKKYDGIHCQLHRMKDRVIIYSDDGADITDRLPNTVAEALQFPHDEFVFDVEVEYWPSGSHAPREDTAGYLHSKGKADDSEIVLNVFDLLYLDGQDIHNEPYVERMKKLTGGFKFEQSTIGKPNLKYRFNLAPSTYVKTEKELREALIRYSKAEASEGAMVKFQTMKYSLNGLTTEILKLKTYAELHCIVWKATETKTKGVYNYDFALAFSQADNVDPKTIVEINGKQYTKAGRSYSTAVKVPIGGIITVRFHTINLYKDPETGHIRVHLYEPIFHEYRESDKYPDSISTAIRIGKESNTLSVKEASDELDDEIVKWTGSKARFVDKILKHMPEDMTGMTLFDPMAGWGSVPFAAIERGCEVILNDANPICYYWLKAVLEGEPLTDDEINAFLNAPKVEGFLTKRRDLIPRPHRREARMHLDGLVHFAMKLPRRKMWTAMGAIASTLIAWAGSYENLYEFKNKPHRASDSIEMNKSTVKRLLGRVHRYQEKYGGHGRVTCRNAFNMKIPKVDIVYYDPPYIAEKLRIKEGDTRYERYWKLASFLLQRETRLPRSDVQKFIELGKKLGKSCKLLLISDTGDDSSAFKWEEVFPNAEIDKFTVISTGYVRGQHRPKKEKVVKVGKLATSDLKKSDLLLEIPPEDQTYRYVVQHHYRGKTCHADVRIEHGPRKDILVGFTLDDLIRGAITKPVLTLADAKKFDADDSHFKIGWNSGKWKTRKRGDKYVNVEVVCQKKAPEPCLVKGSLVWTATGLVPIERIKKGDLVLDASGEWTKVLEVGRVPLKSRLFEVRASRSLKYRMTEHHPVLTESGWVKVSELSKSDKLVFPKVKPTGELDSLIYLQFAQNGKYSTAKVLPLDYLTGYVFGVILGDGHISETGITISLSPDKKRPIEMIEKFCERVERPYKLTGHGTENYFSVAIYDSKLAEFIRSIAYHGKRGSSYLKGLPPIFLQRTNTEFLKGYCDGLVDSDGYRTSRETRFTNSSIELMSSFLFARLLLGEPCAFTENRYEKFGANRVKFTTQKLDIEQEYYSADDEKILLTVWESSEIWKGNCKYVWNLQTEDGTFCLANFATHNTEWLTFEGVTKPGTVGATKQYPGVFHIIERGTCEYGAQKPWIHEFWFHPTKGKGLAGRIIFRQIANIWREKDDVLEKLAEDPFADLDEVVTAERGIEDLPVGQEGFGEAESGWVCIKPVDPEPYVLSRRAERKKWLPPKGISALPAEMRKKIPDELRYWTMEGAKALEARAEIRRRIKRGELKLW